MAAAGRRAKLNFEVMLEAPEKAGGASWWLASEPGAKLGHTGQFDLREVAILAGYKHFNQFVKVSGFDVGLLSTSETDIKWMQHDTREDYGALPTRPR